MIQSNRYGRRALLKQAGLGATMLPLLTTGRRARGAVSYPRRLLVVQAEGGHDDALFFPQGAGQDLLSMTLPATTAPLEPWKKDLIFIGPLANCSSRGGHEFRPNILIGRKYTSADDAEEITAGGISLDQYLGNELAKKVALPVRTLNLAAHFTKYGRAFETTFSAAGVNQWVPSENDPKKAFDRLFANRAPSTGTSSADDAAKRRAMKKSVLDHAVADLGRLAKNLGREDRAKVDAHAAAIRQLEMQIDAIGAQMGAVAACMPPPRPTIDTSKNDDFVDASVAVEVNKNMPAVIRTMMDLTVAAFACDATRIATLAMGHVAGVGLISPSWPDMPSEVFVNGRSYMDHHQDVAHARFHTPVGHAVERWHMLQLAYLLDKLSKTPEPGGPAGETLLDNTVLLYTNPMSSADAHFAYSLPWFMAGKGGGAFKTARFLKFGKWANFDWKGESSTYFFTQPQIDHNALLLTIANAFLDTPLDTWGDLGKGKSTSPGTSTPDPSIKGEIPGLRS